MPITHKGDIAPRVPMSFRMSVKQAGYITGRLDAYDTTIAYNAAKLKTAVTVGKKFGGHDLVVQFVCSEDAAADEWIQQINSVDRQIEAQMNKLHYEVSPEITALLTIAGCESQYSTVNKAWEIWATPQNADRSRVGWVGESEPIEVWNNVLSSYLTTQVPHFEEPQQ